MSQRAAATPRYRQIMEELSGRIQAGQYGVGSQMPTESAMCAEFGASRHTIREALRRLVDLDMVTRRRGSGSHVRAAGPVQRYVQSVQSLESLFQFALDTHFDILGIRMVAPGAAVQRLIRGGPGERWLRVAGIRRDAPGGTPLCFTYSYIPERLAWIAPELRGCTGPFYALLEQRSGEVIREAAQDIAAQAASTTVARALGAAPGTVTLRVLRRYVAERGTLIASFNWHQEQFRYQMTLRRTG